MSSPSVYELSSKNGSDAVLAAANGTFILNNTTAYAQTAKAIVVLEDTLFSTIAHQGLAGNVLSVYVGTPGTALKAGAIIRPIDSNLFTNIKLISGSVILVL